MKERLGYYRRQGTDIKLDQYDITREHRSSSVTGDGFSHAFRRCSGEDDVSTEMLAREWYCRSYPWLNSPFCTHCSSQIIGIAGQVSGW